MQNPKMIFSGDDFTGSTDALNVLGKSGVPCVLFIKELDPAVVENYQFLSPHFRGKQLETFGLAGASRSLSPEKMEEYLRPRYEAAARFTPEYFHYKVCSTFDSSPTVGNIGTAIDVAKKVFGDVPCPVLVCSEHLKRYVVFSHLFAGHYGEVFAINDHPVMSCHPVTPMADSDLRIHLEKQTDDAIGYFHLPELENIDDCDDGCHESENWEKDIIVFDGLTDEHLCNSISLISRHIDSQTKFIVGSSGVEDGMIKYWRGQGSCYTPMHGRVEKAESLLILSGSCSLVSGDQIEHALQNGFEGIRIDPEVVLEHTDREISRIAEQATKMLNEGKFPVIYSAMGPGDPSIEKVLEDGKQHELSKVQGRILSQILENVVPRRIIVAGGDTSSYALDELDVTALELAGPNAGSPLCMIRSKQQELDGVEILLKGGQVGEKEFYSRMLNGWEY